MTAVAGLHFDSGADTIGAMRIGGFGLMRSDRQVVVAFAAQKGGVGKTTLACSFAAEASERGSSVLLVDADPQGSARTWAEIALDMGHPAPDVISMGATMHRRGQLSRISTGYQVVVIDTPPRNSPIMRSALGCADLAVLPCGPYGPDVWSLATTIETVQEVQSERPELAARVVITRAVAHTSTLRATRPVLEESGVPVIEAECGFRMAWAEALAAGQGVIQYAPSSPAAEEMRAVMRELWRVTDGKDNTRTRAPRAAKGAPSATSTRARQIDL